MRRVAVSDSHGRSAGLLRAAELFPEAELLLHLGDGFSDLQQLQRQYPERTIAGVRGNCDMASSLPPVGEYEAQGVRIFYTHGHLYGVKSGQYTIVCAAREKKAQVLLYGHTHQAFTDYEDGLYMMNPGSLNSWEPTYGTLDITPQGIVTNVVKLP